MEAEKITEITPLIQEEFEKTYGSSHDIEQRREAARQRFLNGEKKQNQEPTEAGKRHIAAVKAASDESYSMSNILFEINKHRFQREIKPYPLLTVNDGKKLFKSCFEILSGKMLLIEEENRTKLTQLTNYFLGFEQDEISLHKGIYLVGGVGRGKTATIDAFRLMVSKIEHRLEMANETFVRRSFIIKNVKTIVGELAESKSTAILKKYYLENICLDDIGTEENLKHYGNNMDVIGDLIIERYQKFSNSGLITHATSNILPTEWEKKYGERVASRMKEMFNVIVLTGSDKRS